jgi:uncharacterized protein YndB with AHSA1/START domain
MSQTNSAVTDPTQREVVITREFNAPRELVFDAFTQCEHMSHWFGPKEFTCSHCEADVRPGGKLKLCMSHPEMGDFWVSGVHLEVDRPNRLVITSTADDNEDGAPLFEVLETVTFESVGNRTRVTLVAKPLATHVPEAAQFLSGMEEGWNQSLDKFDNYVGGLYLDSKPPVTVKAEGRELRAKRVYDAPREIVFKAWSDPKGISKWWGPRGFTTTTHKMEVRPGGTWLFTMHGPDGTDYENKVVYEEVVTPERLKYKHSGVGDENDIRFEVTVEFSDLGGKTEMSFVMVFESVEMREHVATFGAIEGLQDTLTRLEVLLEGVSR